VAYSLGVDLGTTFVAAALAVSSHVEMFTLGDRSEVTPAVVYVGEDGNLISGEAVNSLRAMSHPDRVSRVFKRRLGDPTPVVLGGQPYRVTALMGTLLRDVLTRVADSEGEPPRRVVLTHPANWGPFRRALFEEVAAFAGIPDPLLVTEPEAAAARYAASRDLAAGQTVAVYDLGGGTFDATVLRAIPGGVEILGIPEGVERLGGVDFDEAILGYVSFHSNGALDELDLRDQQVAIALSRLRQDCVLAKEALSVDTETSIPVFLPGRHFDVSLTRSDFEDLVRAQIDSTVGALARTLRSARVEPAELSAVLLVGGSSRIPLVAKMVSAELGRPTVVDTHPKYAVALGAATLATRAPAGAGRRSAPPPIPTQAGPPSERPPSAPAGAPRAPGAPAHLAAAARPRYPVQPQYPVRPHSPTHSDTVPPGRFAPIRPVPPLPPPVPLPRARRAPAPPAPPGPPGEDHRSWREPDPPAFPPVAARRPGRRGQVVGAAVVIALALAAAGYVLLRASASAAVGPAQLALTTAQVGFGDSYFATATGFEPGEKVKISWTGPTNGVMDSFPTDPAGKVTHGPVIERDPPGDYLITATGQTSGRSATAPLRVLPAAPSGAAPSGPSEAPGDASEAPSGAPEPNQPGR